VSRGADKTIRARSRTRDLRQTPTGGHQEMRAFGSNRSGLQRLIEPKVIAQASATTGGAVRVDGGNIDAILPQPTVVGHFVPR
jgi:hypothetical protein